ncbi:MAG: MMPL family transporter [Candidatus Eisenbacteria bacterium]|nr:MMPL family transporter [Candidatus Latescibacterota bacterium]MBD3303021.1 MMPL family transporter [Candidatus Eisenbacteria bacterium]
MAGNHVAANILMLVFLIGGLLMGRSIKQEVFPEFDLDIVNVTVAYPGATPSEVEDGIIRPIELAVSAVENVKQVRAVATEGVGNVSVEVIEGADADLVLQDVKSEVDRIQTFPEQAERPVIAMASNRNEVITLVVYGDASERSLRERAERIRDDLQAMEDVTQVELAAVRPYEISIEIPEANLRKYNLTLDRVAGIVRSASLDLAGGSIKSEGGEVLIRTTEKRETAAEFDTLALLTRPDGRRVFLGDIAVIRDGFAEVDQEVRFDGKPAVMIRVFRVGDQTPRGVSETVRDYIERRNEELPSSLNIAVYEDRSIILQQRIDLLMKNGALGLLLVLIILALFLEIRLAFWVAMGIAISFLGAILFLPALDTSINMISLFAFLIILGVVVDDAIVVGENIFVHYRRGKPLLLAAIDGTREVVLPVTFSGLTTMAAFGPLLFVGGFVGAFLGVIPKIVITVLIISLVESFFVLPSHLSGNIVRSRAPIWDRIERRRARFDRFVRWLIDRTYRGTLQRALRNRYTTLAIALAFLFLAIGFVAGGYVKFLFFPRIEADEVIATLTLPPGTPFETTRDYAERIERIGGEILEQSDAGRREGESNLRHRFTLLGQHLGGRGGGPRGGEGGTFATNLAQVRMLLDDPSKRTISSTEFASRWRERVGPIPGVEQLTFSADLVSSGPDMQIEVSHADYGVLLEAADRMKEAIAEYTGTSEISDSHTEGKRELRLRLRPEAASLGISERDLAMQVRAAFYGAEALRIQRGREEVKVMVRYPESDRRNLETISQMRIRTPDGREVPFGQAAYVREGRGFSTINRTDRRRVVSVTARVDRDLASPDEILADLQSGVMPRLEADYPGLSFDLEGQSRDRRESMQSLLQAFGFGLFLIFGLLAIPFRSFLQPFVVMSAIPFGVVGAIGGHLLLGYNLSMISTFGIVALTGVVVNDSLVMIDFINRARREGMPLGEAIVESGQRRFRPILMTSLTTFFGLMPMIFETSIQARFLVPMAISLGFGVLFATSITLILVPTLYRILEDLVGLFRGEEPRTEPEARPASEP